MTTQIDILDAPENGDEHATTTARESIAVKLRPLLDSGPDRRW